jgi:hypothetical protein
MSAVTQEMTTEGGAPLARLADFLGLDDVGLKIDADESWQVVSLTVDSTSTRAEKVRLDPADIDAVCALLQACKARALGVTL